MFEDEDIGVDVSSYHPTPPRSTPLPHPHGPGRRASASTSAPAARRSTTSSIPSSFYSTSSRPSSSTTPTSSSLFDDDDIESTPALSTHAATGVRSTITGSRKGRRSTRRGLIPHSPYCLVLEGGLNRPYLCVFAGDGGQRCNADFSSRQACENHIRSRHTKERLACSYGDCVFSTHDFQNLTKHERTVHRDTL